MRKSSLHLRVVLRRLSLGWRWHVLSGQVCLATGSAPTQDQAKAAARVVRNGFRAGGGK